MKKAILLAVLMCGSMLANAIDVPKLTTTKTGLLVGLQKGLFNGFEMGMERQWKQIKLVKPKTFAISVTGEYLFKANAVGLKVGPWFKLGRADFTYGVYAIVASNFNKSTVGIAPAIGFKILGFHGQVSYNIMNEQHTIEYNRLNISLRYFISKKRTFDLKK